MESRVAARTSAEGYNTRGGNARRSAICGGCRRSGGCRCAIHAGQEVARILFKITEEGLPAIVNRRRIGQKLGIEIRDDRGIRTIIERVHFRMRV